MSTPDKPALTTPVTGPLSVKVFSRAGDETGSVSIDPAEFGGKINKQLLHDVVLMYRANQRAGTHSTLRRGEVAGSTKKLFRQKGTGNARAGTKRTNKRKGGGTAKGPKPRDYSYSLPKKAVRAATRMAILSKFRDGEAVILDDDLAFDAPKTKVMAGILKALKVDDKSILIGTAGLNQTAYRSARNIEGVELLPASQFNALVVLKQRRLLLTKAALEELRQPRPVVRKKKVEAAAAV
jgi:large subunit ribosomal protein L4